MPYPAVPRALLGLAWALPLLAVAAGPVCEVTSGETVTPVLELYTSEGCSSCPPADQWLSTLKGKPVVAQAFHVGYWDYIGWVDRFATHANTTRQRDIANINHLKSIYTPQLVRNGQDWRDFDRALDNPALAKATIHLQRNSDSDNFQATVTPVKGTDSWSAYWTVTEHGHSSHVKSGENSGEFLKHDFVVRQYTPVGTYQGAQTLHFSSIASQSAHPRQINLVVSDPKTGTPLQAVSLTCS